MPASQGTAHPWDVTPQQARNIQTELTAGLIEEDRLDSVATVAGVDVGFEDSGATTRAAVVVLNFPSLEAAEQAVSRLPTCFPYVPGLLSFREIPAILKTLERLKTIPDLLLCDGQGIAHPRRLGIASHLGVLIDRPTIGIAKSRLYGSYGEVPEARGDWTPLRADNNETIGAVLRTRERVKPVFVSLGHKISLVSAIEYVMSCTTRYRLPETTRLADRLASNR